MNLQEIVDLLRNAGLLLSAPDDDPVIGGLADDSRNITAGGLFLAVSGLSVDGHDFIHSSASSGAVAVIAEHAVAFSVPHVRV
jgi:UDP-N-acetylmuramyl pentapeptide synthase